MSKFLILGSNSFSGSNFIDYILKKKHKVIGVSRSKEINSAFLTYKKNKNLTLKEICNYEINELQHRQQLDAEGIEMINCSQQEITDATLEILDRIEGKWSETEKMIKLQNKFKSIFEKNKMSKKSGTRWHGSTIKANYSDKFLLKNKDWLN